jgi:hypothetical protein
MLSQPKETAVEPILEGQAWDRFDALGRPSPNGRDLRILLRILGSVVLAQTPVRQENEPVRNAEILLSFRYA